MIKIEQKEVEGGVVLTAKVESGETIGFGVASLEGPILVLENIHLNPHERGKGRGEKLLDGVINWGVANGACLLSGNFDPEFGEDKGARRFYSKHGIEITPDGRLYKDLF